MNQATKRKAPSQWLPDGDILALKSSDVLRGPCEISLSGMRITKMSKTARLLLHFGENLQLFGLT